MLASSFKAGECGTNPILLGTDTFQPTGCTDAFTAAYACVSKAGVAVAITHFPGTLQVDDSGKVQRLRKACPTCGQGIFMATHFNRMYW